MKRIVLSVLSIFLVCTAQAQNSKQQERRRAKNKGAGVPQEILDAYEARVFDGMPYRLLLPANFDTAKKYPQLNLGTATPTTELGIGDAHNGPEE